MKIKEENGLIYYMVDDEWKLAGRAGNPMTIRYLELLKGNPTCVCNDCEPTNKKN